jgi:hypothetical protein
VAHPGEKKKKRKAKFGYRVDMRENQKRNLSIFLATYRNLS